MKPRGKEALIEMPRLRALSHGVSWLQQHGGRLAPSQLPRGSAVVITALWHLSA